MPPVAADTILAFVHDPAYPLFASWLAGAGFKVDYVAHPGIDFDFAPQHGLVVAVNCYEEPYVTLLRRAMEQGIPTLVLADGILEYFNTWHQPDLPPGSLFQPVMGHKLACLGRSQARMVEAWGSPGRCEVVGMPRFDAYAGLRRRARPAGDPFRVLVTTKLRGYYPPEHRAMVLRSLRDVQAAFAVQPAIDGTRLEPVWRVPPEAEAALGVSSKMTDLTGRELAEILQQVDAVVTWPSTAMLEAMLLGLPVAVLDYRNEPHYVPAAWRMTAAEQIAPVLARLAAPTAAEKLFQQATLHDALECHGPAAPRMRELVRRMLAEGTAARAAGRAPAFPARILPVGADDVAATLPAADPALLHPDAPQFGGHDLRTLQVENGQLRRYAARLELSRGTPVGEAELALRSMRLLDRLGQARQLKGVPEQCAVWQVPVAGGPEAVLYMNPPVALEFELPTGARGRFTTAVAMHPDAWSKVPSCACEFIVRINGRQALALAIDPARNAGDRGWQEITLEVPPSVSAGHQVSLEVNPIGSLNYRWALWRPPLFTWAEAAAPAAATRPAA